MKKIKKIAISLFILSLPLALLAGYFINRNWTIRYAPELDRFFGEGKWECISSEKKESSVHEEYISYSDGTSRRVPGKYFEWRIQVEDGTEKGSVWRITDQVYRLNNRRYFIFSPNLLSAKQAFVMQLMEISFGVVGDDIKRDIIEACFLSPAEADCIDVRMSYHGGNPKSGFYDELWKEPWFNINDVSAEHYLSNESHDFYIDIRAFDYRVAKLSDDEKAHLLNSLAVIEKALCDRFGKYASFSIYLDQDHKLEYENGQRISSD